MFTVDDVIQVGPTLASPSCVKHHHSAIWLMHCDAEVDFVVVMIRIELQEVCW